MAGGGTHGGCRKHWARPHPSPAPYTMWAWPAFRVLGFPDRRIYSASRGDGEFDHVASPWANRVPPHWNWSHSSSRGQGINAVASFESTLSRLLESTTATP